MIVGDGNKLPSDAANWERKNCTFRYFHALFTMFGMKKTAPRTNPARLLIVLAIISRAGSRGSHGDLSCPLLERGWRKSAAVQFVDRRA